LTNPETGNRTWIRFYNKRGAAEQWITEDEQAVKMTRLSLWVATTRSTAAELMNSTTSSQEPVEANAETD
jgi:hypothetical protein